jgi:hypothetical protein
LNMLALRASFIDCPITISASPIGTKKFWHTCPPPGAKPAVEIATTPLTFNLDSHKPNTSSGFYINQLKRNLLVRHLAFEVQFWLQNRVLAFEMMQ